jgi:hypothetical protein
MAGGASSAPACAPRNTATVKMNIAQNIIRFIKSPPLKFLSSTLFLILDYSYFCTNLIAYFLLFLPLFLIRKRYPMNRVFFTPQILSRVLKIESTLFDLS